MKNGLSPNWNRLYESGNLFDSYDDAVNSGEYRELSLIRIATVPVEWEDYD